MEPRLSPDSLRVQPRVDNTLLPAWPELPLGDYVASYRNGFGCRPQGIEQGPIVVRLADIADGRLDLSQPRRVTMSARELATYQLQPNDLLFVRLSGRGDQIGRCVLVDHRRPDLAFSDHLIRVRLSAELDPTYVWLVWNLPPIRDRIIARVATSTGQVLTQELISATRLPIPPLDEQRRIVGTLRAELATLAQAQTALDAQRLAAKALPTAYLRTMLTQLQAENWPQRRLGEVCCLESGVQPPKTIFAQQLQPGYLRLLQIQDFATDTCAVYVPDTPLLRRCGADDLLIARSGSVGRVLRGKAGAYGNGLIKVCPDERVLVPAFVYLLLQSAAFQAHSRAWSQRTAQDGLTVDDLAAFPIPLPPRALQRRLAAALQARLGAVAQIQQRMDTRRDLLRALPAALLRRALQGAYADDSSD